MCVGQVQFASQGRKQCVSHTVHVLLKVLLYNGNESMSYFLRIELDMALPSVTFLAITTSLHDHFLLCLSTDLGLFALLVLCFRSVKSRYCRSKSINNHRANKKVVILGQLVLII